jgi:hypothetical protein
VYALRFASDQPVATITGTSSIPSIRAASTTFPRTDPYHAASAIL